MPFGHQLFRPRSNLVVLIFSHIVISCVSLIFVSRFHFVGFPYEATTFHMFYDPARLYGVIVIVAVFAIVSFLFIFARFSFGYFVGFYFFTMVLGYLWLNYFSNFDYNHRLAAASAAVSAMAFLSPALFISSPVRQVYTLSSNALELVLRFILLLACTTVVVASFYNLRLVALDDINNFRNKIEFPTIVSYLLEIISSVLLPFAFACFVAQKNHWRAGAALLILVLFYPITLSKLAFFTPFWLVVIVLLSKIFESRAAVVLTQLLPMLAGVILIIVFNERAAKYFGIVNFRMFAIPSNAMDVYNDFFSRHAYTYFCQISFFKPWMYCPYQEPLAIVMKKAYELGNYNASLFATEGIASVGPIFAPLAAFLCGLVIAAGNVASAGLPPRFIMISGAILPQILLNVPLSTVLLTHGAAVLFLLWYITPRTVYEQKVFA